MRSTHRARAAVLTVAACLAALPALARTACAEQAADPPPRKVYAHYMGCWPAATGPLRWERVASQPKTLRHTSRDAAAKFGGHVRNFDLAPPEANLTPEQSADLEIRRAMRIGIDGFAVDAWAGGGDARRTLDALFKVAEEKDYPFEVTICLDPMCGGDIVASVKELLEKHGQSPKLARRGGKPLVLGYMSWCYGMGWVASRVDQKLPEAERKAAMDRLRTSSEGWDLMGQAFPNAAEKIGRPIYFHYCMSGFFHNVDRQMVQKGMLTEAAEVLAGHVPAIGGFTWLGPEQEDIARVVKAKGAEWCQPVGHYQKENIPFECYTPPATEWMGCWDGARATGATLLQIITWNDYGENTNIAPAYNTRYGLYDLTGFYIAWWKTGKEPVPDHDRVYLNYHKYPKGSSIFPFKARFGDRDYVLEVLTILPRPATIRLPGRNAEYEAPAGFFRKHLPLTAGPVVAEVVRDGQVALRLESPEPVTDRPFREDHGLVCFSTEDARYWKEDFGDVPPFWYSEYGDADGDGLPNWFEMYWFGTWLDFRTATGAKPDADPDGDGKTNLEEYRAQTDPTLGPLPTVPDPDALE